MNRYYISLPMILVVPIVTGLLYFLSFKSKKLRTIIRFVVPAVYATINAYFIGTDSFYGIVDFWHKEQLNTSIKYSIGMVSPTLFVIGVILFLLGFFFSAPALNYAVHKRLSSSDTTFGEYLEAMSRIKKARKPERKPFRQRIKDLLNFDDDEEEDNGVYFNIK